MACTCASDCSVGGGGRGCPAAAGEGRGYDSTTVMNEAGRQLNALHSTAVIVPVFIPNVVYEFKEEVCFL